MRTKDALNTWDSCKWALSQGSVENYRKQTPEEPQSLKVGLLKGERWVWEMSVMTVERPLGGRRRKQRKRQILPEIRSWDRACHWCSCVTFLIPSFFVCNLQAIPLSSMTKQFTGSNLRICSGSWFECPPWKRRHGGWGQRSEGKF